MCGTRLIQMSLTVVKLTRFRTLPNEAFYGKAGKGEKNFYVIWLYFSAVRQSFRGKYNSVKAGHWQNRMQSVNDN